MLLHAQPVAAQIQSHKIELRVGLKINTREESRTSSLTYNAQSPENLSVPWILVSLAASPGCTSHTGFRLNFSQKKAQAGDWSTKGERCWGVSFYLFSCFTTSLTIAASL